MELMSSLLFYILAVLMPQALGISEFIKLPDTTFNKFELNSLEGKNATSYVTDIDKAKNNTALQSYEDSICSRCYVCMDRAIKTQDIRNVAGSYQRTFDLKHGKIRDKRTTFNTQNYIRKKSKKSKDKNSKSVSIIKYNDNNKIYALKVKESVAQTDIRNLNNSITTCQVYSVQKHFPCESPDANLILKVSNKKVNKNKRREQSKKQKNVSNMKTTVIAPTFRKREIDSSQVPEQIISSIEEMY